MKDSCVILAKSLETWKKLILEHGKEKVLDVLSVELDKLISNSDFETAYMTIKDFQDHLELLSFYEHFSDDQKERLRKFGWAIFEEKKEKNSE